MTKRTVLNEVYKGMVESMSIPAELHERGGRKFASFGSVLPIHCATEDQVLELAKTTHHYCDVFTDGLLAPLGELAYVRIDENTAEKVFINRSKRILLTSSDGQLAQWRCAPIFESANQYIAGTPIVNQDGALVSVVTAKRGNHYAVSSFEGEGGYFDTSVPWKVLSAAGFVYGEHAFAAREQLRAHVARLPPAHAQSPAPAAPVLHAAAPAPRVVLLAGNGRQGEGGYFDTSVPWKVLSAAGFVYGEHAFAAREQLRAHVARLPPAHAQSPAPAAPVLHAAAPAPRVVLLAGNGRQGEGGYFDTSVPWKVLSAAGFVYGEHAFAAREQLRAHVARLPPAHAQSPAPAAPVLHAAAPAPRVVLLAGNGRQVAHIYLQGVHADGIEYL